MGIVIILLAVLLLVIFLLPKGGKKKRKRKKAVGKIYKTTDGFFNKKDHIKKDRRVAVIDQRKDDGAVAVVKIYKKAGKEKKFKEGKTYIPDLVLSPQEHKSLEEDSIVGREVFFGKKGKTDPKPQAIFPMDLEETGDKLKLKEYRKIKAEVHNDTPQFRKTYKTKKKRWHKHFKQ